MRADDPAPDRDGDDPCQGAKVRKGPPKGDGNELRPDGDKGADRADLEARRLALALRHSLLAA